MISGVKQLEEALNERQLAVAESLQSLMAAEEKFKEKMKEVVKKLKQENDDYMKSVGKLKNMQQRPIKQPKQQIDLNVEDTSDLQNLFGLERFNQLKTALAPLVVSTLNPHYHQQFLHKSQRTDKYVPGLDRPMFEITTKKVVIDCIREFAISGGDFPTDVHEAARHLNIQSSKKLSLDCKISWNSTYNAV